MSVDEKDLELRVNVTEINNCLIKQEDTFVPNINATRGVDLVSYIKIGRLTDHLVSLILRAYVTF